MKKKTKSSFNNKLRSCSGESIAETLIAVLISSLALVMLAGSISAASGIITRERKKIDSYYQKNEIVVNQSSDGVDGNISITGLSDGISVKYYVNNEFKNDPVITYKKSN